jgi:hypothetical protein
MLLLFEERGVLVLAVLPRGIVSGWRGVLVMVLVIVPPQGILSGWRHGRKVLSGIIKAIG